MSYCAPMSSPPPSASCIHGVLLLWWEQPGGGAAGGGLLAQGLAQAAVVSGQHASHIRGCCHWSAGPHTEWQSSWAPGPFVESSPATQDLLWSDQPLDDTEVGGFLLAFLASCYFGAISGHQLSPECRRGLSPRNSWGSELGRGGCC